MNMRELAEVSARKMVVPAKAGTHNPCIGGCAEPLFKASSISLAVSFLLRSMGPRLRGDDRIYATTL
jgi:hypothetical protein